MFGDDDNPMIERTTPASLVKEFFPHLSNKQAMDFAWRHTSFPVFRSEDPAGEMRQQLVAVKNTLEAGGRPCDFCGHPSVDSGWLCRRCSCDWEEFKERVKFEESVHNIKEFFGKLLPTTLDEKGDTDEKEDG